MLERRTRLPFKSGENPLPALPRNTGSGGKTAWANAYKQLKFHPFPLGAFSTFVLGVGVACLQGQQMQITTLGDNTVNMLLIDKSGGQINQYIAKLRGSVAVDTSGNVTSLDGSIKSLDTSDNNSVPVSSTKLVDWKLLITTQDGKTYTIYNLNSNLVGLIKSMPEADAPTTLPTTAPATQASDDAKIDDISGSWTLSAAFPQSGVTGMEIDLHLVQSGASITGTATGNEPVKGTVNGTSVVLQVGVDSLLAEKTFISYQGAIATKDKMQGTVQMPQFGQGTWTASPSYALGPSAGNFSAAKPRRRWRPGGFWLKKSA